MHGHTVLPIHGALLVLEHSETYTRVTGSVPLAHASNTLYAARTSGHVQFYSLQE
eukprot:m.376100 g.376100  ORF g.376100 m.376100 type:complete len:55 (-) comp81040_c0_seq1:182-346(-)